MTRPVYAFVGALMLLHLAGAIAPGLFTWGFHSLAYLHLSAVLLYGAASTLFLFAIMTRPTTRIIDRLAAAFERKPQKVLVVTLGTFALAAILLRVRVPLLGDSFILIKLYQNTFTGGHLFPASHQPLSLFLFYEATRILGSFEFPQILDSFLVIEIFLGGVFITLSSVIVKELFGEWRTRSTAFCFLLALPCLQLFFGYVEVYAIVLVTLALYVTAAMLYLRSKLAFHWIPLGLVPMLLAHYMSALLLPSFLFLAVLEYRRAGLRRIGGSLLVSVAIAGAAVLLLGGDVAKFIPPPRSSPLLSIGATDDAYQAYTLFAPEHLIDLLNLAVLLCPGALFLLTWSFFRKRGAFTASAPASFLTIAAIPAVLFFLVAKFHLPMAQDWDAAAPFAWLLLLWSLLITATWLGTHAPEAFGIMAVSAFLNVLPYYFLNSTVQPNLARVETFLDPRISSHDGCYQSSLHLTEYYIHAGDSAGIARVCEKFIRLFPSDERGYSNYTLYLQQFGPAMDDRIEGIFLNWLAHDPESATAKEQFANFHLDAGNRSYRGGDLPSARDHLLRSLRIDPTRADAYNSLGIVYKKMGMRDSAILLYKKTVQLDPQGVYAYINLGNIYDDLGNSKEAIAWYEKALVLRPEDPTLLFNIAIANFKRGAVREALEMMKRAARKGEPDAQAFLAQRGERW